MSHEKPLPVRISKSFKWEMAHRLPDHQAGCQNIHGHSYRLDVVLTGWPHPNGMVMDYGDLKSIVQPVVDRLDHAFMCSSDDTVMTLFLEENPEFKAVHVEFPTTAENIASYFLNEIQPRLSSAHNLIAIHIRVSETLSTYAEVSAEFVRDYDAS